MRPVRTSSACLAVVCSLLSAITASAETLRLGFTDLPPYSFQVNEDGPQGLTIDLVEEIAARTGYDFEFVAMGNPGELLDALQAGEVDATSLLAISDARTAFGAYTDQVGRFAIELTFAEPAPESALAGNLAGLRIAAGRGSYPARLLSETDGVTVVEVDSFGDRLIALLSGEVDAVAGARQSLYRVASAAGLTTYLAETTVEIESIENALMVGADRADLLAAFNTALAAMRADGTLEAIEASWFATGPFSFRDWAAHHLSLVLYIFGAVVAVLVATLALQEGRNRNRRRDAARTQTMLEAFDLAQVGIVIFDASSRAEVANAAFRAAFPDQAKGIDTKETLPELLGRANRSGAFGDILDERELESAVGRFTGLLSRGESFETMVQNARGRLFSQRGLRLSEGRIAIVSADVSDLEAGRRALAEQADALQQANNRLEAFSRVAAHDLKSPANSAATLLDWISEDLDEAGIVAPKDVAQSLEKAQTLLRRLVNLIDDLLAYSQASGESGRAVAFEPNQRVSSVLEMVDLPLGFEVNVSPDMPSAVADPAGFDLVIRNLISNAVKHHDRLRGKVDISARPVGSEVEFEIADDGPGVPEAYHERVFEPFFKLRTHDEVEGTGLGLSMIHAAVASWNGRIALDTSQSGRGTTVRFTVPAEAAAECLGAASAA